MLNLRQRIIKGGAYLVARQGLGLVIGLAGVVLLTRVIGPDNYGLYASALGITGYLNTLAGLGVPVYLVRCKDEPGPLVYRQAFTLALVAGATGTLLGIAALPLFGRWFANPAFIPPLLVMLTALPVAVLAGPPLAKLERELNYRAVSLVELAGQLINHTIAIALAYRGMGVWAPVAGYWAGQIVTVVAAWCKARLVPRPYWSWPLVREITSYGAGYSASMWVWQLRSLVNPLVAGRYLGPGAVGYVALAIRVVEALSFVKGVTWRVSIAAFAKLQGDPLRLKRAMEEAMVLQVLASGPLLAAFACTAPRVLNLLFGARWDAVLLVFPFIALGTLVNTLFSMHSSVLYVLGQNWAVTRFHLVHMVILAGSAMVLLPRYGLPGYGMAELLALLSYLVIHLPVRRLLHPSCTGALTWIIPFVFPLFVTVITLPAGLLLYLPVLAVLFLRQPWKRVPENIRLIKTRDW